jgi:transcriptional regulator with XRE-family HTH domain
MKCQDVSLQCEPREDYKVKTEMAQQASSLGNFVLTEMTRRQMTAREFANFVGVTHTTINRLLEHGVGDKSVNDPSLDVLDKLAKATSTDICSLVALVKPDTARISPFARMLAERIERLPADKREFLDTYLIGLSLKENQPGDEVK